ncbi:endosome protein [Cubamyces lactineus]|nr:endosome protein [Cubamyces lactineus]
MSWLKALKSDKGKAVRYAPPPGPPPNLSAPPEWMPAPEASHTAGLYADASEGEYQAAERFCDKYPPEPPKLLPSRIVERIDAQGCRAWQIEQPRSLRFRGTISNVGDGKGSLGVVKITAEDACQDICLLSDLPILAGLYDIQGKLGVYYEIKILRMDGLIAIGSACRPYPPWRLPGWNRLSAALHLDDLRKFFEDPDGGRDYVCDPPLTRIAPGDTVGFGYAFALGTVFFTHNGVRLPDAFTGVYLPRERHDVYAAIGVEGRCEFEVNFGGDVFRWKEGNEWAWRVEGHVGTLAGGRGGADDELPTYEELRGGRS